MCRSASAALSRRCSGRARPAQPLEFPRFNPGPCGSDRKRHKPCITAWLQPCRESAANPWLQPLRLSSRPSTGNSRMFFGRAGQARLCEFSVWYPLCLKKLCRSSRSCGRNFPAAAEERSTSIIKVAFRSGCNKTARAGLRGGEERGGTHEIAGPGVTDASCHPRGLKPVHLRYASA